MRRALIFASALLVTACEPVGEAPDIPEGSAAEATSLIIADDVERRNLIAAAERGDGASAYLLSLDAPDPEGRRWLERAGRLDWPEAKRDKAMQILREEPCRVEEARTLLVAYRATRTAPDQETASIDRLVATAEADRSPC
jgi:hypothetical protein